MTFTLHMLVLLLICSDRSIAVQAAINLAFGGVGFLGFVFVFDVIHLGAAQSTLQNIRKKEASNYTQCALQERMIKEQGSPEVDCDLRT